MCQYALRFKRQTYDSNVTPGEHSRQYIVNMSRFPAKFHLNEGNADCMLKYLHTDKVTCSFVTREAVFSKCWDIYMPTKPRSEDSHRNVQRIT